MRIVVASLVLVSAAMACSQTVRAKWIQYDPNGTTTPWRIVQTKGGGYVVYSYGQGLNRLAAYGPSGATQWIKSLGSNVEPYAMLPLTDGSVILSGVMSVSQTETRHYLAKVAVSGGTMWVNTFSIDPAQTSQGTRVIQGRNGNLIAIGTHTNSGYIVEFSPQGQRLRHLAFPTPGESVLAERLMQASDGTYRVLFNSQLPLGPSRTSIWTVTEDLNSGSVFHDPTMIADDIALYSDGSTVLAGCRLDAGNYSRGSLMKLSPNGSIAWRYDDPQSGFFYRNVSVDAQNRAVAFNFNGGFQGVIRMSAAGARLSYQDIGHPDRSFSNLNPFVDRYGRHFVIGSAYVGGDNDPLFGFLRGTQWVGTDHLYMRTFSPGEGYNVWDATFNENTGEVAAATSGFGSSIICLQQAAEALDDSFTMPPNAPFSPTRSVLYNDRFAGDATAVLVTPPANGTVALTPDGRFTYTPGPGFAGLDGFTYRAVKPGLTPSLATVTLTAR